MQSVIIWTLQRFTGHFWEKSCYYVWQISRLDTLYRVFKMSRKCPFTYYCMYTVYIVSISKLSVSFYIVETFVFKSIVQL